MFFYSWLFAFHPHDFAIDIEMHRMKVCLVVTESASWGCQFYVRPSSTHVPTLLSVNIHLTLPQDPEADHVDHPPSPGVWPGASWVENPSTRLINDLFPAPASSNARNYTEWATQTTFINVEFFNSIFLRDTYLMIYDLSRSFSLVASLPRCCLIRCHPSPDDTGWQLDMITNNLQEQSSGRVMDSVKTNF